MHNRMSISCSRSVFWNRKPAFRTLECANPKLKTPKIRFVVWRCLRFGIGNWEFIVCGFMFAVCACGLCLVSSLNFEVCGVLWLQFIVCSLFRICCCKFVVHDWLVAACCFLILRSYDECSLSLAICIAICKFCCLWFVDLGWFVVLCGLLFSVHNGCCVVFILCNLSVWRLKLLLCCSRKKQSLVWIPKLPINTPQMSFTNPQTVCANCTITSPQQCSHKH